MQTFFVLTTDGITITPEQWAAVFVKGAAPSQTLELELTARAQSQFRVSFAAPIPGTKSKSTSIPHPDAFLGESGSSGFKGRLREHSHVQFLLLGVSGGGPENDVHAVYCLQELVANSLDATKASGETRRIKIQLHQRDDKQAHAITVQDFGCGMDDVRCG